LITNDDVAVLGALSDDGVLTTRRRRLSVGEAHQREVDALSRLCYDHPRTGHRRADPERPRRVAGDDARLAAGDRVHTGVSGSQVPTTKHTTVAAAAGAGAAMTTTWDVGRY